MVAITRTHILFFGVILCSVDCSKKDDEAKTDDDEKFVLDLIWNCTGTENAETCLKSKAATLLDGLVRTKDPLQITEYLSLARDPNVPEILDQGTDNSNRGLEINSLEEEKETDDVLDKVIWNRLTALFTTRKIQLTFPSDVFEGRGKEDKIFKKSQGIFLMAAMMKGMMMKMALAKIALIAGKALLIAKLALILSLIISLKKLLGSGGGGGGGGQAEVVYASSEHGSGGWQRKFGSYPSHWEEGGADLAYNAYHSRNL